MPWFIENVVALYAETGCYDAAQHGTERLFESSIKNDWKTNDKRLDF